MKKLILEQKIMGCDFRLISAALFILTALAAQFAGELLDIGIVGFEVVFPFYAAVAAGEWGRLKADKNFDIISAQTRSLFNWVLLRFFTVFGMVTLVAGASMAAAVLLRGGTDWAELFLLYFAPAFFLSSVGTLCSLLFAREHTATLSCGILWLVMLLTRSMVRIKYVEYVYLFIRYAGDPNGIWLINKMVLIWGGGILWVIIWLLCRKRVCFAG